MIENKNINLNKKLGHQVFLSHLQDSTIPSLLFCGTTAASTSARLVFEVEQALILF
jgi:hypothetical protein